MCLISIIPWTLGSPKHFVKHGQSTSYHKGIPLVSTTLLLVQCVEHPVGTRAIVGDDHRVYNTKTVRVCCWFCPYCQSFSDGSDILDCFLVLLGAQCSTISGEDVFLTTYRNFSQIVSQPFSTILKILRYRFDDSFDVSSVHGSRTIWPCYFEPTTQMSLKKYYVTDETIFFVC